jgi:hypothetical protein
MAKQDFPKSWKPEFWEKLEWQKFEEIPKSLQRLRNSEFWNSFNPIQNSWIPRVNFGMEPKHFRVHLLGINESWISGILISHSLN